MVVLCLGLSQLLLYVRSIMRLLLRWLIVWSLRFYWLRVLVDGISPKQLSELKQRLERGEINKEEIHGLTNVQARISLLYGSESGLTVNSGTEGGFCVRMKIAVLKNG